MSHDADGHVDEHESRDELDLLRHSTAHVLAAAVTELWPGTKYAIGPPIENGFYYDFDSPHVFTPDDFKEIEKKMRSIIGRNLPFTQERKPKPEALDTFRRLGQDYKVELIEDRVADDEQVSLYRTGEDFLDLCRGPHVPSAGSIKAFKLLRVAGAYWKGDEHNRQLQRIYGTAWPSQKEQDEYLEMLAEAERRDHKKLGRELKLFTINELSGAGLPLWLPNGATVRREIERWVVDEELKRGYQHVITPNLARLELFIKSGHWERYRESMYPPMVFEDGEQLELRAMNCPHHILVYQSELRSYRDLPLRIAEVGMNYRYERSGTLQGMNRVRAFALNDAHIFCSQEQVEGEVKASIELALYFSEVLGIDDFWYRLSTRDNLKDKWVGSLEEWETAEEDLASALESLGQEYRLGPGEAAFYGPKIDFQVRDALRREFTNSTVQVDFQLPQLFDLEYVGEDGSRKRPVMVHRGAAGSMERLFAYLIERWAGAFPTWLAPVQVVVIPITDEQNEYAHSVAARLRSENVRVAVDDESERMQKKVREAKKMKVPYLAIVGAREAESGQVNIRNRADEEGPEALVDFAARITAEIAEKRRPDR
jgi:threonyl-tRNA synthetase